MRDDTVGCVCAHGLSQGAVWRFSALSGEVASVLAGLLGGEPQNGGDDGWGVVTAASVLRVNVTAAGETALRFRLAEAAGLGEFELRFSPWGLATVLGVEPGTLADQSSGSLLYDLAARVVDFTTLGGRIVRFPAPSLARCA